MATSKQFRFKKEILIALFLVGCLLAGLGILTLIEGAVGRPVYYDGDMKNICVRINEICLSNRSVTADQNGEFSDYIELYNYGESFSLAGFGLANDTGNGVAYTFGEQQFEKGAHLVVFLDGVNVPFKLSTAGNEYIALVAWDGTVICSATTIPCGGDEVMLYSDTGYYVSDTPSPGYANDQAGVEEFKNGIIDDDPAVIISELLIGNGSVLPDFEGEYCDIIELRNISENVVNLAGCYLSDTMENRSRCALPPVDLQPGEYFVVFASGKGLTTESGEYHTSFRISEGEEVILSRNGKYSSVTAEWMGTNVSQLFGTNEQGAVVYVPGQASPGFDNTDTGVEEFALSRMDQNASLVITELMLDSDETCYGGLRQNVIEITNISDSVVCSEGWFISDSDDDPYKYALPSVMLQPGECMLLFARKGTGERVTGFSLSSSETLYLTTPDFKRASSVSCASAGRGKTWQRVADYDGGTDSLTSAVLNVAYISGEPSIGFPNTDEGALKYQSHVRPLEVEISEAVALNTKYLAGPYGTYHDFVELHNLTDSSVTLDGWFISDDPEEPKKASLDGVRISAGGYVVIMLSTDGKNVPSNYKSVAFSLSSAGETLVLSKGDEIVDCMVMPTLGANTAYGRADGRDGFSVLSEPTPRNKNGTPVASASPAPSAVTAQGVYEEPSGILVELSGEGTVYYTLDCTPPTADSAVYTQPISLSKTTVVRCISVCEGKPASEIASFTYVINEGHQLPVVSLVTDPANLWDYYTGIYETGPGADSVFPYVGANYWQPWEKPANISLFASDGGFSENCGIKIFGGYSRALAKKSFSCFFRAKYGAGSLDYKLFPDSDLTVYEGLVLRNSGQDWNKAHMRDPMLTSLVSQHTTIDVQKNRATVLYLNGEYWGVYFIREKINENYIAGNHNVSPDTVDLCRASGTTSESYTALIKYVSTHDLSVQENYDYVASLVDVDNYMDYIIAEICMANTDNGNIRFYKIDGDKWRWIMFDVDQSFRYADDKTVAAHLNPNGTGSMDRFPTRLINGLLKNKDFKKKFLERFAWQLENIWDPQVVNAHIDTYVELIGEEMKRDTARWGREYSVWEDGVQVLRDFIAKREAILVAQVQSYFSLSDSEMIAYGFDI